MGADKRKHVDDSGDEIYSNQSRARSSVAARVDPTYGQRSALPLDEDWDFENEDGGVGYDEEMDALEYLKSVRREAGGIPNVLAAPQPSPLIEGREIYENGVGDYRGRYEDGAFYACPESDPNDQEPNTVKEERESKYREAILARFYLLRDRLRQTPPLEALQKVDDDHPIYLGRYTVEKVRWWRWKLLTTDPVPAQVASMDKDTVLGLLKIMAGGALMRRGIKVEMGVSRWAWSLLAKLPERGQLSSEEIAIIRELGKKAVLVAVGLREGSKWDEDLQVVEAEYDEDGTEDNAVTIVEGDEINIDNANDEALEHDDELNSNIKEDDLILTAEQDAHSEPKGHDAILEGEAAVYREGAMLDVSSDLDELAAAKARMLGLLSNSLPETDINIEPDVESEEETTSSAPEVQKGIPATDPKSSEKGTGPEPENPSWNSNATVDMILIIAGEVYGQRDLLEFCGS